MPDFFLTFMSDHPNANRYKRIVAPDYAEARHIAFHTYGPKWAFLYTQEEFLSSYADPSGMTELEPPLHVIEPRTRPLAEPPVPGALTNVPVGAHIDDTTRLIFMAAHECYILWDQKAEFCQLWQADKTGRMDGPMRGNVKTYVDFRDAVDDAIRTVRAERISEPVNNK